MEGLAIQAMWHIGPIKPLGWLVLVVLCVIAIKCGALRTLLGGLVALWVAVVGAQALWHTLYFRPPQPMIVHDVQHWRGLRAPAPPEAPDAATIHAGASHGVIAGNKRIAIEKHIATEATETVDAETSQSFTEVETPDSTIGEETASANEPRPDWLDAPLKRIDDVERTVVSAGPWKTFEECTADLDAATMNAVLKYMEKTFGTKLGSISDVRNMGITESYVRQNICTEQYVETSMHDFGGIEEEMYTVHVLMEFDPSARRFLENAVVAHQRRENLSRVSLAGGGVLGLLALVYGLLKVDTWTKGYYSRRLLVGVPAAIVVLGLVILAINSL